MKKNNDKFISIGLILIALLYTCLGAFQIYTKADTSYKLKKMVSDLYYATCKSNKLIGKIHFIKDSEENKKNSTPIQEKSSKDIQKFIFLNNTFSISNNGILILFR